MVKVSICIPAYNDYEALKRCVDSILSQDFESYEIIITDDSPNDKLRCIEELDNRIKYIKNNPSLGSPKNWNKGLSLAKGEFVKTMHHDDYFLQTDALSKMVTALDSQPKALFAVCSHICIGNGTYLKHPLQYGKLKKLKKDDCILLNDNFIGPPSVLLLRNDKKRLYDENMIWFVDIDLYISLLRENNKYVIIDDYLVAFGVSETQTTSHCMNNSGIIVKEYLYMMRKYSLENSQYYKDSFLKLLAKLGIISNDMLKVKGVDYKLSNNNVRKIRLYRFHYLSVLYLKKVKRSVVKQIKSIVKQ